MKRTTNYTNLTNFQKILRQRANVYELLCSAYIDLYLCVPMIRINSDACVPNPYITFVKFVQFVVK